MNFQLQRRLASSQSRKSLTALIIGQGSLIIPCGELLFREGHEIRSIISENPEVVHWARMSAIFGLLLGQAFEINGGALFTPRTRRNSNDSESYYP